MLGRGNSQRTGHTSSTNIRSEDIITCQTLHIFSWFSTKLIASLSW